MCVVVSTAWQQEGSGFSTGLNTVRSCLKVPGLTSRQRSSLSRQLSSWVLVLLKLQTCTFMLLVNLTLPRVEKVVGFLCLPAINHGVETTQLG